MVAQKIDLLKMTQAELDGLYAASQAGRIPDGRARGTALWAPGSGLNPVLATFSRWLAWQGKTFDAGAGELLNRVTPFGVRAIRARVYLGPSLFDKGESIILDYSTTSVVGRSVRDEIREVAPGTYLGYAYRHGRRVISFALEFPG